MADKKEYAVFVKEALLEPKHYKKLSERNAIFLYLWFLQKVTHVDKKTGLGIVLGGKPFKSGDFGLVSSRVSSLMLQVLERGGYVQTTLTPYGKVVWVTKCVKYFGRNIEQFAGFSRQLGMDLEVEQNVPALSKRVTQNVQPLTQNVQPNKTIQLDNTVTTNTSLVEESRLVNLLHESAMRNYRFIKPMKPDKLTRDAEELERMHRIDGYSYQLIEAVITWSQQDNFWKQNVRSVKSLRKQFESLMVKAQTQMQRVVVIRP